MLSTSIPTEVNNWPIMARPKWQMLEMDRFDFKTMPMMQHKLIEQLQPPIKRIAFVSIINALISHAHSCSRER
jgi:hypothetical protein